MARRVLIIFAVVLLMTALVGAFSGDDNEAVKPPERPAGAPVGELQVVDAQLPGDEIVRVAVGDLVELEVTADEPDSVSIDGLGLTEAVAPGAPAELSFLADRAGSFPVQLTLSEERVGRLVVEAP